MIRIFIMTLACLTFATATASAAPERLNSGKVLPTTLPFSEAVKMGDTLYLSGQIGNLPGSLKLAKGGLIGETKQVMANIKTSLEAHGYEMSDLIKCTVFLADIAEWDDFNEVYATYFEAGQFPARSAFGGVDLAINARVEVECIAAK